MFRSFAFLFALMAVVTAHAKAASAVPASAKHSAVKTALHDGTQTVNVHGTSYTITVKNHQVVRIVPKSTAGHHFASTPLAITRVQEGGSCYNCWYDAHGNWICIEQC